MILTILGGGGFRVPLVYGALLADHEPGRVTEVRLFDPDTGRLGVIARILAAQADGVPDAPVVRLHTDLGDAVRGTDVVFSAIRVGGAAGRACDERIALAHRVIGQETVGAGGISYALRTIPVAVRIAETIAREAPDAFVINFTNPAGLITEVMTRTLGDRVVGICDSPVGLARRALRAAGITDRAAVAGADIAYAGLNHLGWITGLRVPGPAGGAPRDVLPDLLADPTALGSFEEGRLFGPDWLQTLGALPNEYLHYYYFAREQLAQDLAQERPRGAFLADQQAAFYAAADGAADPWRVWDNARLDRERTYLAANREAAGGFERDAADLTSGGYEQVALAIMHAVGRDVATDVIVNVPNRGVLADLDAEAVVEVGCRIAGGGALTRPVTAVVPEHGRGLVTTIKQVERLTMTAATAGSRRHALLALASHPLIDSVAVADAILDDLAAEFAAVAALR